MFAPIYLPQAPAPSPEILAAERDILADEGRLTVAGFQYASESDASQARRPEAERRVRNFDRFTSWYARQVARQESAAGESRRETRADDHVLDYRLTEDRASIERIIGVRAAHIGARGVARKPVEVA